MTTFVYRHDFPTDDLPQSDAAIPQAVADRLSRVTGLDADQCNWILRGQQGQNAFYALYYLRDDYAIHRHAMAKLADQGIRHLHQEPDHPEITAAGCVLPTLWQYHNTEPNPDLIDADRMNREPDQQDQLLLALEASGNSAPTSVTGFHATQDPDTGVISISWYAAAIIGPSP